jgi:hypothetical protein
MQKKNIEFTEDAIRQKIELSPIEKYIKYGTILPIFLTLSRKVPLEDYNLRRITYFYHNSSHRHGRDCQFISKAPPPSL